MRSFGQALAAVLIVLPFSLAGSAEAAGDGEKTVRFQGEEARVPASWPVYRLAEQPRMCVRMDREAVYLGRPSSSQRCPAQAAVGRVEAILIEGEAGGKPEASASAIPVAPVAGPSVYTGLGFDACAAPSSRAMESWLESSPYRAIGVYIGGLNRACSQPNLTSDWVAEQVAAGWHLIPTYVGLQAPTSSCTSCARLSTFAAATQGAAAADDAVADAQAIGMGPGSPLYFDMESYTRTSSASRATLTFLAAYTERLHALGYKSGVYSSSASGIADLVSRIGTGEVLPDNIWTANWNGQRNTDDPFVPDTAWSLQQRIHQYRGGHDETFGGVAINIDNNYLDGATVGAPVAPPPIPPLTVSRVKAVGRALKVTVRCGWEAAIVCPGQIILRTQMRTPARGPGGRLLRTKVVRVGVARRAFRLGGGRAHTFRVVLNARGRPLLELRGRLRGQLLVAIPGARVTRAVEIAG